MKLFQTVCILVLIFWSGCASNRYDAFYQKDFEPLFQNSLHSFCPLIHDRTIIVGDILRYSDLQPTKVGLYLTEHLKTAVTKECHVKLYPLELARSIQISKEGSRIFTREYDRLRLKSLPSTYLLTGTYTLTDNSITIFLKLINLRSGKIEKGDRVQTLFYIDNPLEEPDPFTPQLEE